MPIGGFGRTEGKIEVENKPISGAKPTAATSDSLEKAFAIYYEHGQAGKATTNTLLEAIVEKLLSKEKVAEIKAKIEANQPKDQ